MLPNGTWAEPENLGETINTSYNENYPYLSNDGKTSIYGAYLDSSPLPFSYASRSASASKLSAVMHALNGTRSISAPAELRS